MSSPPSSPPPIDSVLSGQPAHRHRPQGYTREHLEAWDLLPMRLLKEHHDPLVYEKPPLLHFGIGLDVERAAKGESLVPWARERGLNVEPEKGFDLGFALSETARNVVKYLTDKCAYRFELIVPWSADYDTIIAIYNNYDLPANILDDETEGMIMDVLREIMNDPNQEPLWYYDRKRAFGSAHYPSRRLKH
ncbi:hypothetical protein K488DRAFT_89150 [Vararia minispora EC-137]|uniref:Uncharacterized protein n=1 Tax=Vararia minispora EC-137 TaxID=1314806 RepID=A0ACB8QBP4_9AGAM|nr:hypothetical protein K488DRAFT_89150 [Vararia minispora EC-137]